MSTSDAAPSAIEKRLSARRTARPIAQLQCEEYPGRAEADGAGRQRPSACTRDLRVDVAIDDVVVGAARAAHDDRADGEECDQAKIAADIGVPIQAAQCQPEYARPGREARCRSAGRGASNADKAARIPARVRPRCWEWRLQGQRSWAILAHSNGREQGGRCRRIPTTSEFMAKDAESDLTYPGGKVRLYVEAALGEGARVIPDEAQAHYLLQCHAREGRRHGSAFQRSRRRMACRASRKYQSGICVLVCASEPRTAIACAGYLARFRADQKNSGRLCRTESDRAGRAPSAARLHAPHHRHARQSRTHARQRHRSGRAVRAAGCARDRANLSL